MEICLFSYHVKMISICKVDCGETLKVDQQLRNVDWVCLIDNFHYCLTITSVHYAFAFTFTFIA